MRGRVDDQPPLFHVLSVEDRIRPDHPLRDVKRRVDAALAAMDAPVAAAYRRTGRPSVPPERWPEALPPMALAPTRSAPQSCDRIDTALLFRGFLDLGPSEDAFDPATSCEDRDRPEEHRPTQAVFDAGVGRATARGSCGEHFAVDGTRIGRFAPARSVRPKDEPGAEADGNAFRPRNPEVDFRGRKRTRGTHASRTGPGSRRSRKGIGRGAKRPHRGHLVAERRHGLIVGAAASEASGTAERRAASEVLTRAERRHQLRPEALGADKGYGAGAFLRELGRRKVTPHAPIVEPPRDPTAVPQEDPPPGTRARRRMPARLGADGDTLSRRCREKSEEGAGWIKTVAGRARRRWVGRWERRPMAEVAAAAGNLARMRKRIPA